MAKSFIDNTDVNGTVKHFDANALIGIVPAQFTNSKFRRAIFCNKEVA